MDTIDDENPDHPCIELYMIAEGADNITFVDFNDFMFVDSDYFDVTTKNACGRIC